MTRKLKSRLLRPLFRLFSFLADRTNGWVIFVRPKLFFGSLMLGLGMGAASCFGGGSTSCYEPAPEPTCYLPAPTDSITPPATDSSPAASVNPALGDDSIPLPPVMCYKIIAPADGEN